MAQRFLLVGDKAYRETHMLDATQDPAFKPGLPIVEFDETVRINEFFSITEFKPGDDGKLMKSGQFYARTIGEVFDRIGNSGTINIQKIMVSPYLERKKRSDAGQGRGRRSE